MKVYKYESIQIWKYSNTMGFKYDQHQNSLKNICCGLDDIIKSPLAKGVAFSTDGYLSRKALYNTTGSQCLKITEKVSFKLATFWVDKVHWKCQNCSILASIWKPKVCSQVVLPDRSILIGSKIGGKCQNVKIEMRHFK